MQAPHSESELLSETISLFGDGHQVFRSDPFALHLGIISPSATYGNHYLIRSDNIGIITVTNKGRDLQQGAVVGIWVYDFMLTFDEESS
ncbi:hypothetical protein AZE42_10885 [Rhizopogon vesiculosus]|uniref:Uncharacterized protein n=1 Tax=Rhizopogon vesiculosus TaxID=180088 RepID=A0A1J8R7K5_9AGAM|nr:hypothetical protein AZE42_10885 [Rhizopogon vesiculosus]